MEAIDPNSNMSSCSRDSKKLWALASVKYSLENNVLHGFPSANLHPHVASKNLSHVANSDACSDSDRFCLAMKALVIAVCLGVDEQVACACGVHTTSGESKGNVEESGNTGNSMIAVNLMMMSVLIFA